MGDLGVFLDANIDLSSKSNLVVYIEKIVRQKLSFRAFTLHSKAVQYEFIF